jgi:hypothetical protein
MLTQPTIGKLNRYRNKCNIIVIDIYYVRA